MSTDLSRDAIIKDALGAITTPITIDALLMHCYADGIPLTRTQARHICKMSEEAIAEGGFFTMINKAEGAGVIFVFNNREGDARACVNLNTPMQSKDRKIPNRSWLKQLFAHIEYPEDSMEFKYVHRLIDSHIRDGGTWVCHLNGDSITFTLSVNDKIKTRLEFRKEDLTK